MTLLPTVVCLFLAYGCGGKAPPEPLPASEPPPAEETQEALQEELESAASMEEAPPEPVQNVDLQVTVSRADGSSHAGRVTRVERSEDWFAESGWTASAADVKLGLASDGTERAVEWSQVKSITVSFGKVSESTDCTYDSNFMPWMYDCTLRTEATATTVDGATGKVTNRHKWRLVYDDGHQEEFWLVKHPAREQDSRTVSISDETGENYEMYGMLQDRLREEVKTLVTGIRVSAN